MIDNYGTHVADEADQCPIWCPACKSEEAERRASGLHQRLEEVALALATLQSDLGLAIGEVRAIAGIIGNGP